MTVMIKRLVGVATAAAWLLCGPAAVAADTVQQPPRISVVSPARIPLTGDPVRVTISGSGFTGTSTVATDPPIVSRSFSVFNDSTILLTLPADTPAGAYTVHVSTPAGTDVSANGFTVTPRSVAAATPDPGGAGVGASRPAVSLAPAPEVQGSTAGAAAPGGSATGVTAGSSSAAAPAVGVPAASSSGVNPVVAALLGFAIGGLLYVLWGKEGRLRVARRQGLLAQLWARPVQRLRLGRICLHCGRLHYIIGTRRDLWKAGQFCSATCFVADQEAELAVASSEEMAPSRMRAATVYVDLEENLQAALRAEASDLGSSLFTQTGAANRPLVPQPVADSAAADHSPGPQPVVETAAALQPPLPPSVEGTDPDAGAEALEPGDEERLAISA